MPPDFRTLSLSPSLLQVVGELGYGAPTPIQRDGIPVLLAGKDLIGQSETGSGKTAAFALPILQKLHLERRRLQSLIVCPTRELCAQVSRDVRRLGRRHSGLQVLGVAGGAPFSPQASALARGVHIAVGTPGRLLDHLRRGTMETQAIVTVVLDEADRMLDMGFQPDMEKILAALPASRQTAFFSATFPKTIAAMSEAHQRDAVRVNTGEAEEVPSEIRQIAIAATPADRLRALYWSLNEHPHESVLVFCNFKKTVASLKDALLSAGASVDCLHGDLEQFKRDQVLARFRNRSVRILLATDVAGRGIDVADLDLVVNYELPPQPEVYVHRIGRTGRAGKRGLAVSIATPREGRRLDDIEEVTGTPIERVSETASSAGGADRLAPENAGRAKMETILISGGRKDKVRPGDILGALTGDAGGLKAADVGKIEIHDRLSYVAVSRELSRGAVRSLNGGRIKARRFRASLVS